jgi:hypothetical protein
MSESQINQNNNSKEIQITSEEKLKIITSFHTDLKNIDLKKETIEKISNDIQEQMSKYGDQIIYEIFQIIESESQITPRLEYLYLINDIIEKYKEFQININKIFPYIKNICLYSYTTLNENLTLKVKELIELWEKKQILNPNKIKELKFYLKIQLEPELSEDKEEINFLINLYNNGYIKFDQNLINFSKELNVLEKTKDNKNRRNLLKMEKDIINKQLKIYNSQIQHLKEIDKILDKIKTFNELENEGNNNQIDKNEDNE